MSNTALRLQAPVAGPDGTRLLRPTRQTYVDGAEERVLEILRSVDDVSTGSPELLDQAQGWAERYHLTPQRSVILQFLDIPAGTRVLEVGAGCGPITRFLGERGAIVDAVEPMPARARVNRERCRDLPQVEVFVGELNDVPLERSYDLVVIVGVLEYVGSGSKDEEPYLEFLTGLAQRLAPGGQLALAIENQLGVKYLAGAPEDHTNRIYDSIEGYPTRGGARTFSRKKLTSLITRAGFDVDNVLAAFPDYKLTRAVLDESLDTVDPSLAYRIPQFPSPDYVLPRPEALDEFAAWRTLVDAGLAWEFGNSFLVCAHVDGGSGTLWPTGQYAGFATLERRQGLAAESRLVAGAQGPIIRRTIVGTSTNGSLVASGGDSVFVPGRDLIEVLAESDDETIAALLGQWNELLNGLDFQAGAPLDALPHNIIVARDGTMTLIDDELRAADWTKDQILARGIFWTAVKLAERTSPERWPASTVADLATLLGKHFPENLTGEWLSEAVQAEATIQTIVLRTVDRADLADTLGGKLATPLGDLGLGHRVWDRAAGANADLRTATVALQEAEQQHLDQQEATGRALADLSEELDRERAVGLELSAQLKGKAAELEVLRSSRTFRIAATANGVRRRVLGALRRH